MTDQTLPKYFRPLPVNVKRIFPKIKNEYLKSKIIEADSQFASLNWDDFDITVLYPSSHGGYSNTRESINYLKTEGDALVLGQEKIEQTKYTKVKLHLKRDSEILNKYKDPNKEYLFKFNTITTHDFYKTHYSDFLNQTFDGSQFDEVMKLLKQAFGEQSDRDFTRYDIKDSRENILETYLLFPYIKSDSIGYLKAISDEGKKPSDYFNEKITEVINTITRYFNEYESKEDKSDFDLSSALSSLTNVTDYVTLPDYMNSKLTSIISDRMAKPGYIVRYDSSDPNAIYNHYLKYKDVLTNINNYSMIGGNSLNAVQDIYYINEIYNTDVSMFGKSFNLKLNRYNVQEKTSLNLVIDEDERNIFSDYINTHNQYKPGMFDLVKEKLAYIHFKYDVPENTNLLELPDHDELMINVSAIDIADVE